MNLIKFIYVLSPFLATTFEPCRRRRCFCFCLISISRPFGVQNVTHTRSTKSESQKLTQNVVSSVDATPIGDDNGKFYHKHCMLRTRLDGRETREKEHRISLSALLV
jgi:hypothetical protein